MTNTAPATPGTGRDHAVTVRLHDAQTIAWRSPHLAMIVTPQRRAAVAAVRLDPRLSDRAITRALLDALTPILTPSAATCGHTLRAVVHTHHAAPVYAAGEATGEHVQGFVYYGHLEIGVVLGAQPHRHTDDDDLTAVMDAVAAA